MKVTSQDFVQFLHDVLSLEQSHLANLSMDFLQLLAEFLPAVFPLNSELSVLAFGTVVCKSQESKSFRFFPRLRQLSSANFPNSIRRLFSS